MTHQEWVHKREDWIDRYFGSNCDFPVTARKAFEELCPEPEDADLPPLTCAAVWNITGEPPDCCALCHDQDDVDSAHEGWYEDEPGYSFGWICYPAYWALSRYRKKTQ